MPSPVGHTLAGLSGYMLVRNHVGPYARRWVLFGSVVLANLPDLDFLPGLLLGDLRSFHHQATHSLAAVAAVTLSSIAIASWWKLDRFAWGTWGGSVYLSHVVLDLLVDDPSPPFGVQLLWPFSESYFISPIRKRASAVMLQEGAGSPP